MKQLLKSLIQTHCVADFFLSWLSGFSDFRDRFFRRLRSLFLLSSFRFLYNFCVFNHFRFFLLLLVFFKCLKVRHFLRLSRKFFKSPVIFLLLGRRKRLILHLQFHCLIYILAFTEPEDQIITLFQTLGCHSGFLIQFCQFISPFFNIFRLLKFFESLNLLFDRCSLCPQDLIAKDILIWIFRSNLHKIIVEVNSFIHISRLQCKSTQAIDNLPASFRTAVNVIKHLIAFLIFPVFLIYIADIHQHRNIAHFPPVNLVRQFCCLPI